jgi:hypothetical protein
MSREHRHLILCDILLLRSAGMFPETVSNPSFRDFLVYAQRRSDEHFLAKHAEHQHELLYRCLQLLNRNICPDVCEIRVPGPAKDDPKAVDATVKSMRADGYSDCGESSCVPMSG